MGLREEIEDEDWDEGDIFQDIMKIQAQAKEVKRGESKTVVCPLCGGVRHIAKAQNNGHFLSICENKDCLRSIQ